MFLLLQGGTDGTEGVPGVEELCFLGETVTAEDDVTCGGVTVTALQGTGNNRLRRRQQAGIYRFSDVWPVL